MLRYLLCVLAVGSLLLCPPGFDAADQPAKQLKAGIIGLDTSHVVAFASVFNGPKVKEEFAGVRIVAAYPGGSPDLPSSRDRVVGYTNTLRDKFGVEIVDSIDALLQKVDVVFLESVDGRPHLKQVRPVLQARKPVFIDKPLAGSLADAIQIFQLAKELNTPCFSSSSLRFTPSVFGMRKNPKVGEVVGCGVYSPCSLEEHHPDLFWYGIHGVEMLFTVMGTGCESVVRVHTKDTDFVIGTWKGGRIGTYRGIRPPGRAEYGAVAFGTKGIVSSERYAGYEPMLVEICKFFRTGKPPVCAEETLEMFAFMEAADESKRQGGVPVSLEKVMAKARAQIAQQKKE
jgi:predicted dehydrogenase